MAENPEITNPTNAASDKPNSSPANSEAEGLLGLAVMVAAVAIPPLVGYIVGKVNSKKEEHAPKIINARPIAVKSSRIPAIPALLLQNVTRDISALDRRSEIHKIIGRDEEVYQMAGYLGGKLPQSLLLVGEDGIGKTALVEGLVQAVQLGKYPELQNFVVLEVDPAQLVGEDSNALIKLISLARDGAIVFFNNFQDLTQKEISTRHPLELALFERALSNHKCRCIVAINNEGYKQLNTAHPGFEKLFIEQRIEKKKSPDQIFGELNQDIVFQILSWQVADYPKIYGLQVKPQAIEAAISLSEKYISDERLPGKGIDLLEETARRMRPQMSTLPLELIKGDKDLIELESRKQRTESNHDGNDPDITKDIQNLEIAIQSARSRKNQLEAAWKEVKKQQQDIFDMIIEITALNRALEASVSNQANALTTLFRHQLAQKKEQQRKIEKFLDGMSDQFASLRMEMDGGDVARTLSEKLGYPI